MRIGFGRYGPGKGPHILFAKEVLIVSGRRAGANMRTLSGITGLSLSSVTRRNDAAVLKMRENGKLRDITKQVIALYEKE